jgi:hypothetical protein
MEQEPKEGMVVKPDKASLLSNPMSGAHSLSMSDEEAALIYSGKDGEDLAADDPYRRILDQILSAETPDSVLTPVEAKNANDYIGVPLLLFGFGLQESTYEAGTPFYAALECRDVEKDEPVVLTSGHRKILAQLVKLRQFVQQGQAEWPFKVMIRGRGLGQGGSPLLELGKWPEDYVPPSERGEVPF